MNGSTLNGEAMNGRPALNGSMPKSEATNGHAAISGETPNGKTMNGHTAMNGQTSDCDATNGMPITGKPTNGTSSSGEVPIAICGMALRLPGGLKTPQDLWKFLLAKGDARTRVPESRYNISAYYSPTGKPGTIITEQACFLDESVDLGHLDTSFFNMPRMEVERADPQQRLMLEVARECFEDAGEVNWRGKSIGCYMGSFGEDWCEMFAKEPQQWGLYRVVGFGDFVLSNRLSYEMDLQGPSMTIRTGCSAALVGLNEACMAISRGDCKSALVGGVNLIMAPGMTTAMTEQGVLAKDGSCKTFSADADGYGRGEAITAVYIKPLSDAIKDGNPVRAVIRSTASNCDGKTPGMSCPSTDAQETMMRRAYDVAGITDFSQTAFVECHGTGTPTGDPIEANAVARVFGDSGVYIGSVKPNLGHSEGASGLVSLMKVVLALEHRTIPPNIKFSSPNPAIPFETAKLIVPVEPTPWPQSRHERASINSFGIGGVNAHVILDSAASFNASTAPAQAPDTPQLLLYSANSPKSLTRMIDNYREFVEKNPESIGDLAYTLANRREHLTHRAFAVASRGGLGTVSPMTKSGQPPKVVMVFTGQGAQWPRMGRELLDSNSIFRTSIRSLDRYLQDMSEGAPQWRIEEELRKPAKTSRLDKAEFSQPLCTAIQIALVDTLEALGVEPSAVVGHSSGEIAAAYAAGALTAEEAVIVAVHRGAAMNKQKRVGAMAAIGMSWEETEKFLVPKVTIACDNSPKSVTLSGDADKIEAVVVNIQKSRSDVMAKMLQVDKAYHSYHMAEIGEDYHSLICHRIVQKEPAKLFFSSVTGNLLDQGNSLGSRYWQRNLESPVLFRAAVESILQHSIGQNPVFLEIGPHSGLAGPLRQILTLGSSTAPYVSAMIRNQNCMESFLSTVGKLYTLQVAVDLKSLIPSGTCLPDLPRYPWNHEDSYWYESRLCKEWRLRQYPHHDLLGVRVAESTDFEPVWRNLLHLDNASWIRDHKVADDVVFPFAGYIAIAGEAIRQTSEISEAFSLRHVIVSTALVLTDGKPTEIMTTFRRHRLTASLNSHWWEFTIASHNGHIWTKHCTGEAMAQSENLGPVRKPNLLPRKVGTRKWYDTMRRAGLDLGPSFQCLDDIKASTSSQQQATAKAINNRQGDEANYYLHPTVIDCSLQLLGVAATRGFSRKYRKGLPTSIEELSISRCSSDLTVSVSSKFTGNTAVVGEGQCIADGNTILRMSGVRLSLVEDINPTDSSDTHAAARYEWGSDIDFMDAKELIKPSIDLTLYMPSLNDLSILCLVYSQRRLAGSTTEVHHMQKLKTWIHDQLLSMDSSLLGDLDNEKILDRVDTLVHRLSDTPAACAATALHAVCTNIFSLFSGQITSLEALLPDEIIAKLYSFIDQCDRSSFIQHLAHSKPNLRVLEIGAGRGSSTSDNLKALTLPDGRILCSKYTFTSKGFVSATEHSKAFPNMEYVTLDIGKDPLEQGFEDRQYDLVIATNVLHGTKSLEESLRNIRKLLHPHGRLLLQELCSPLKWVNYIFGTLPSWWSGSADGRFNEPYVSTTRWESELVAAGYDGLDAVILDSEIPSQLNAIMIAKPFMGKTVAKRVTLLCGDQASDPGPILQQLERRGYEVLRCTLDDPPPPEQDVIALLDRDGPFFENMDSTRFESFKNFLHNLGDLGILWVTPLSQMYCRDPRYAQVIGTARTIRTEMLIDFASCEVDDIDSSCDQIIRVFGKFQMREGDDLLKPDFEYAICNGIINVGRFYPFALCDELMTSDPSDKLVLDVGIPGRLSSLHWSRRAIVSLQRDEVEVEVHSVGLNFRDVLVGMGLVELSEQVFGLEAAGVVCRTGPDIKNLCVGDRVVLLERHTFSTFVTTSEMLCIKMPDNLNFNEGATMFFPYATAMYSLINVGSLVEGQSVLIHSACGGVGLAAIQLAQMLRAEIYATVGNDEKVQYLMSSFNIPRNKIFNSRNISFVDDLMRETRGKGVDLVLNSLSGELLHATWRCVAEFGKMVEIGKRDLIGAGKLDMNVFLANRSYCCVDIDRFRERPSVLNQLIKSTMEYFQKGYISPIRPVKVFSAASIYDAFRYMQQGQHIGRIVISIRDPSESIKLDAGIIKRKKTITFDGSASYLLIGGLGGLGRAISTWMVEHNARHLIYLSRNAGMGSADKTFIHELESMGCDAQLVQGSVSNPEDVARAVAGAAGPLKGIVQMSMVLRDQAFPRMTVDDWNTATSPKIQGTWNLHNATISAEIELDFFVLFSSLSGIIGQPGQANYASGNTFLDAFVQYRTSLGLPASAIDIGAVEEIGFISENQGLLKKMKTTGFSGIMEQDLLDALAVAMTPRSTGTTDPRNHGSRFVERNSFVLGLGSTIPLSSPGNRAVWRKDRRMAVYHNTVSGIIDSTAINETLKSYLSSAKNDTSILKTAEASALFASEIGKKLFSLLLKPEEDLNTSWPLADLGMDSLVAIELRTWWKQMFAFDISVLEMLGIGTLDALGKHAAEGLLKTAMGEGDEVNGPK